MHNNCPPSRGPETDQVAVRAEGSSSIERCARYHRGWSPTDRCFARSLSVSITAIMQTNGTVAKFGA